MNKTNFISALIGALVALILKSFFDRLNIALKLNRMRKVILDYSVYIGLDKSDHYIKDLEYIAGYIMARSEEDILKYQEMNYSVDSMPMFTGEIFKSFSQDELRRVSYSSENYIRILDIQYSINFLREYLPLELYNKYQIEVRKHMEEKKILAKDETNHFIECGYLHSLEQDAIYEIDVKKSRAEQTHQQFHKLIETLNGNNLSWILKYLINQ